VPAGEATFSAFLRLGAVFAVMILRGSRSTPRSLQGQATSCAGRRFVAASRR
jgi:hypothetical protein